MNPHTRFLFIFLLPVLIVLPVGIVSALFLARCGELDSVEKVVANQQISKGLYGSAIHPNAYPYKLALYRARKPDVVAIGSSRVLQFRQEHFSMPFVSMGMAANYPAEAEKLLDDILEIHKPSLVILGIDFWWGNPRWIHAPNFDHHKLRGGELTPEALGAPLQWLVDRKISWNLVLGRVIGPSENVASKGNMIGVQAIASGNGFAPDGSRHYSDVLYGRRPPEDPGFSDTARRIATDSAQFKYGEMVAVERIESLKRFVLRLKNAGVAVVTVIPPVAPSVEKMMQNAGQKYAYVHELQIQLQGIGDHHFDFFSAGSLGGNDCEFVDGFHGGDVISARMVLEFSKKPDLARYVRLKSIRHAISDYSGMASADRSYANSGEYEIDFLGIGCNKSEPKHATSAR